MVPFGASKIALCLPPIASWELHCPFLSTFLLTVRDSGKQVASVLHRLYWFEVLFIRSPVNGPVGGGEAFMRLLIVDDHLLARRSIRIALEFCQSCQPEIVGEASDGATAMSLARLLLPDVVTMDIGLPDCNGLELTRALRVELPMTDVIVVTADQEEKQREEAFRAGAIAYVVKQYLVDELPTLLDRLATAHSGLRPR